MHDDLLELFPNGGCRHRLEGLYRDRPIARLDDDPRPRVYTNFVSSLDGRIAMEHPNGGPRVPATIANARDWRLFQELAAHADIIITSGRYLRDLNLGNAQDHLPVGEDSAFEDLRRWRLERGLKAQPDIAVLTYGLSFVLPRRLFDQGRDVHIFAAHPLNAAAVRHHEAAGARVHAAPEGSGVSGGFLVDVLAELGYRRIYSVTGPKVLHTLARDQVLDTLFLTIRMRLLGGESFQTIMEGAGLPSPANFILTSLYLDTHATAGPGQLFMRFDREPGSRT